MSPYGSVYTPSIIPSGCDNCKAVSPLEACYIRPKHCELLLHCVSASSFFPTEKMPPPNPVPMTSTPAIPVPKAKCLVCKKKTFKTAQALQDHQTALNHQPVPCPQCNKEFSTKDAMEMHKRTCEKPTKSAISTRTAQLQVQKTATPLLPFQQQRQQRQRLGDTLLLASLPPAKHYNGHPFAVLDTVEQDLIFEHLLARCHSFNRLQSQNYTLPVTAVAGKVNAPGTGITRADFRQIPEASTSRYPRKRRAIAIDCEMVEVACGQRELVLLSAVDFLTGEVLINHYVKPTAMVKDWKPKISGVTSDATSDAMAAAVAAGQALRGWKAARQALWEFASDQTVFIGHSLNADLNVLGTFPGRVVDSAILTSEAVFPSVPSTFPLKRMWSLKTLARDLLGCEIQMGNKGHNCLEDTMSTREVVIWCIRNPEQLKVWAENARDQHKANTRPTQGQQKAGWF